MKFNDPLAPRTLAAQLVRRLSSFRVLDWTISSLSWRGRMNRFPGGWLLTAPPEDSRTRSGQRRRDGGSGSPAFTPQW
ncbi:hypothetical protein ACFYZ2_16380 [Streptomyces sviceus]|uniref:hypothetical protein n=1 Tax=Streptomyces sviceus TaxID=285530 RepID=UPI0036B04112